MNIDRVDRQLIHALRVDGRAPFARLSAVLGVSAQTIARRYRRLREAGVIRVVVMPGTRAAGQPWLIRLRVRPGAAERVAAAIASRPDASWVGIVAGGAEILWMSRPETTQQADVLLLQRLPANELVTGVSAHAVLRTFDGRDEQEWSLADALAAQQRAALSADREAAGLLGVTGAAAAPVAAPEDAALAELLRHDGRAGYAELGARAGISASRARRRVTALLANDLLRVELEVAVGAIGIPSRSWVWMRVSPAELEPTGQAIAQLPETAYAAAVTGEENLVAVVVTADAAALYGYLTERLGALPGVRDVTVAPVLRQVKQEGSVPHAGRLPRPGEADDSSGGGQSQARE